MADSKLQKENSNSENMHTIAARWKVNKKDLVPPTYAGATNLVQSNEFNHLRNFVHANSEKLTDSEAIMELLSDLELAFQTLTANILSPQDLQKAKLNITVDPAAPPEIAELIREHFVKVYPLEAKLEEFLKEALCVKGSKILIPIPPSAISKLITSNSYTTEQLNESVIKKIENDIPNVGLIGTTYKESGTYVTESLQESIITQYIKESTDKVRPVITIKDNKSKPVEYLSEIFNVDKSKVTKTLEEDVVLTDNPLHLAVPYIKTAVNKNNTRKILDEAFGLEGFDFMTGNKSYENKLLQNAKYVPSTHLDFTDLTNDSLNPLVLEIPQEAWITVHTPGQPKNIVGGYIFIDDFGYPIHLTRTNNRFKQLSKRLDKTMQDQTLVNNLSMGVSLHNNNINRAEQEAQNEKQFLLSAYTKRFEEMLRKAITDSSNGQTVEIGNPGELYRIMFARQLARQRTKVVYVSSDMAEYIAFNYSDTGTGISLIEKTKLYSSFRAILMFAQVMAGVNSSLNRSLMTVNVDKNDSDPYGTVDTVLNEFASLQASGLPLGNFQPIDIVDALQKSATQVKIIGENFPATDVVLEDTKREISGPNQELLDSLKAMQYAAFGLSIETVERTNDIEFAATITTANNMQSKRIRALGETYELHLTSFVKKYIRAGGPLLAAIKKLYEKVQSSTDLTLAEVIASVAVKLPEPDTSIIVEQAKDYTTYSDFITVAIEPFISDEMIKDLIDNEKVNASVEDLKLAVLNKLKREYLRSKNMLPELDKLIQDTDDSVSNSLQQHADALIKLAGNVYRHIHKKGFAEGKKDDDLEAKLNPPEENEEDNGDGGEGDNSDDNGGVDEDGNPIDNGGEENPEDGDTGEGDDVGAGADEEEGGEPEDDSNPFDDDNLDVDNGIANADKDNFNKSKEENKPGTDEPTPETNDEDTGEPEPTDDTSEDNTPEEDDSTPEPESTEDDNEETSVEDDDVEDKEPEPKETPEKEEPVEKEVKEEPEEKPEPPKEKEPEKPEEPKKEEPKPEPKKEEEPEKETPKSPEKEETEKPTDKEKPEDKDSEKDKEKPTDDKSKEENTKPESKYELDANGKPKLDKDGNKILKKKEPEE